MIQPWTSSSIDAPLDRTQSGIYARQWRHEIVARRFDVVAADDVMLRTVVVVLMINAMHVTVDGAHATPTPNGVADATIDAIVRDRYAAGQWSLRYRTVSGDICKERVREKTDLYY